MSASGYTNMDQFSCRSLPNRESFSQSPSLRSRSAPIRTGSNFPNFCNRIAYYSMYPPSAPIYLFTISSLSHESNGFEKPSKIRNDESKSIVQQVLQLVLNTVVRKTEGHTSAKTVSVGSSVQVLSQSVAIQTELKAGNNGQLNNEGISSSSSAESCIEREEKWVKDLRTLRDAHVRLVLRQLRQLQDIERLGRVYTNKNLPQAVSSTRQLDQRTIDTNI